MNDHIEIPASDPNIGVEPPFETEVEMEKIFKEAVKSTFEESKFVPTKDGEMHVVSVSEPPKDLDETSGEVLKSAEKAYETINSIPENLDESSIDDLFDSVNAAPEEDILVKFFPAYDALTEEDIEDVKKRIKFDEFEDLRFSEAYIKLSQVKDELSSLLGNAKSIMDYTQAKEALSEMLDDAKKYQEELEANIRVEDPEPAVMAGRMRVAQIENNLRSIEKGHEEYAEEFQDFLENFNKNLLKLKYAVDLLQQKVEAFKDAPDKITFILNEMLYLNQKRIDRLEEAKKNGASEKSIRLEQAHIDTIASAVEDAKNASYILSKYNHKDPKFIKELKRFKKNTYDDISFIYDKINVIRTNSRGRVRLALPKEDLEIMEATLKERFGITENATKSENDFIFFTMMWLLSKLKSGLSTGYSTYYSLFFRSICDIHNGTYDLQDPEEYLKHLDTLFEEYKAAEKML